MNTVQKLDFLCNLLEKSKLPYAAECLSHVRKETVYFFPGAPLKTSHAYTTYRTRCDMQHKKIAGRSLEGYNSLLNNLAEEKESEILCLSIKTQQTEYVIFTTTNMHRLVGVLRSFAKEHSPASRIKALNQHYRAQGLKVSGKFFTKKALTE